MIDLVGHTINAAEYNEEDQTLSLTVDGDKVFLIRVNGDCCSTGKFIDVATPYRSHLPQKVVSVKDNDNSFDIGSNSYVVYKTTLVLENGKKIEILYDNMSNGYYGSSLDAYYSGKKLYSFDDVLKLDVKK